MNERLHLDNLDGAVTLFKSTEEGTETIAVFDEEHREVIEHLVKEVNRFYDFWEMCKSEDAIVYRLNLAHEYIDDLTEEGDYEAWLSAIGEERRDA